MAPKKQGQPDDQEKRREGRPTKLTPELQKELCDMLEIGAYFEPACWSLGIAPKTGFEWLKRGDPDTGDDHPEGIYSEFRKAISRASALAEINATRILMAVAVGDVKGDARAAIELLRRRWSARWGDTQKIKIDTGEVDRITGAVLQVVRESLDATITDTELRKRATARVLDGLSQLTGGGAQDTTSA